VVVVGPSGSGKSELINALYGYCEKSVSEAKLAPISVTGEAIKTIQLIHFKDEHDVDYALQLYDTRGLTDSHASFEVMIADWNQLIKKEITEIHFVLIVLPVDRLSMSLLEEVAVMADALIGWGMQKEHVILCLNKCDFFKEKNLAEFEAQIKGMAELPEIIREAPIVRTCFLNAGTVVEEIARIANEKMEDSTNRLTRELTAEVVPFTPRPIQLLKEQREAIQAAAERDRQAQAAREQTTKEAKRRGTCAIS